MKYILLFCGTVQDQQAFEALSEEALEQRYTKVARWFAENGSRIVESQQLQPPRTATTVRFERDSQPVITDGPFIEGNEIIGGYATIEVPDLDEALRLAKNWPGGGAVEVRPAVEH